VIQLLKLTASLENQLTILIFRELQVCVKLQEQCTENFFWKNLLNEPAGDSPEGQRSPGRLGICQEEILKVQEQATPLCQKMSLQGRRPAWLNRELRLELRKKKKKGVYDLCKKGQATQEDYKDVVTYAGRKSQGPNPTRA